MTAEKKQKFFNVGGLWMFVAGFSVLMISLSLSDYKLTTNTVKAQGDGEKYDVLLEATEEMFGKHYNWNFNFIADLRKAFKKANKAIIQKYTITGDLAEHLANRSQQGNKYKFDKSIIDKVLPPDNHTSEYQNTTLKNYVAWIENQSFSSKTELTKQLETAIRNYHNSLSYQKAFDAYTTDKLIFWITKRSSLGTVASDTIIWIFLSIGLMTVGALIHLYGYYKNALPGIKNDHIYHDSITSLGWLGIGLGAFMILFYIVLYFYPEYITNWVLLVDPISKFINGGPASHWFLYGFLYTLAILVMGIRMLLKYHKNNYQVLRTISVMFFQTAFAFIIPEILIALNKPGYDFKNIWPLDYDFFYGYNLSALMESGMLGWFMLIWGIALILIAVPVITYFYGKRWYCSWVCGCGGLAETLGDPFRQLSDKSLKAWKIERWLIHFVLVFALVNTAGVLYTFFTGNYSVLGISTEGIKTSYGFLISSMFAGVIGTGFYPIMGNRVWCRFGCPLAAYLGIVQRFKSRFRITTNGGQCISCGNCSTYCEMGIDVRWYAQRGQNIVRSSCVGCGICSSVCPRGVLRLENSNENDRKGVEKLVGNKNVLLVK